MSTSTPTMIERFSLGPIQVTVWINTSQSGARYPSTKVERRYKDKDGNFQSTNAFSRDALPVVADLVTKAWTHIKELESDPNGPFTKAPSQQQSNEGR